MYMYLFGVRIDQVSLEEVVVMVASVIKEPRRLPLFIVTPNPEQIVQAQDDEEFRTVLNEADLNIPDGWGLVLASMLIAKNSKFKIQNSKFSQTTDSPRASLAESRRDEAGHKPQAVLTERVSGVEVMEKLIEMAGEKGWKVMLLGAHDNVAHRAAEKLGLLKRSDLLGPGDIDKVGPYWIKGMQGITDIKNSDREEEQKTIEEINAFEPDLLFVGFGAPWQEKWVAKQLKIQNSKFKVKVVMVVGGAIDQIIDGSLRPPGWLDRVGLGWLYRLIRQPSRWRRQLRLVRFGWMVLRKRIEN